MRLRITTVFVLATALSQAVAAFGQDYKFHTLDVPRAISTAPKGVNPQGV